MCDSFIVAYETGPVTIATIPYIRGTSETIARILQPNSIPPKKEELKTKGIHFFFGGGGVQGGIRCIMGLMCKWRIAFGHLLQAY